MRIINHSSTPPGVSVQTSLGSNDEKTLQRAKDLERRIAAENDEKSEKKEVAQSITSNDMQVNGDVSYLLVYKVGPNSKIVSMKYEIVNRKSIQV